MDKQKLVRKVKAFCVKHSIPTNGVLVITVQESKAFGKFASLVVDFSANKLLDNYPPELCKTSKQLGVPGFSIHYAAGLPSLSNSGSNEKKPFCCDQVKPFKEERTSMDKEFANFLQGQFHIIGHANLSSY